MNFQDVFDNSGNFILKNFDPYRVGDSEKEVEIREWIDSLDLRDVQSEIHRRHNEVGADVLSYACDLITLYYGILMEYNTNYTRIYMWK